MNKNRALGKGLSSLLPRSQGAPAGAPVGVQPQVFVPPPPAPALPVTELGIDAIQTNPNQPRKDFRQGQLLELAVSITRDGIIQPLVVRNIAKKSETAKYELVAGERRLRAARLAGLEKVPVVVQEISDERLLEVALIENIQREDLNPMELAIAFERMATELSLNHEEIGARTGKDRATITNSIRLLQLPKELQEMVAKRELSAGHARAVLKLHNEADQKELAKRIIAEGWTVRKAESYTPPAPVGKAAKAAAAIEAIDPNVKAAVHEMERALGTRVRIQEKSPGKGKIEIEYYSSDDLDRIYNLISSQV
jgi:ParB family transcriptional regulator, chromosome partitioning protein